MPKSQSLIEIPTKVVSGTSLVATTHAYVSLLARIMLIVLLTEDQVEDSDLYQSLDNFFAYWSDPMFLLAFPLLLAGSGLVLVCDRRV